MSGPPDRIHGTRTERSVEAAHRLLDLLKASGYSTQEILDVAYIMRHKTATFKTLRVG